jgi:hypothetical protein
MPPKGSAMNRDYASLLIQVLARLFPESALRKEVLDILVVYGREEFHQEVERVRLGVLRISGTDLGKIQQNTNLACTDFRDLLVAAEYPLTFNQDRLRENDPAEYAKLKQREREEYDAWLSQALV